MKIICVLLTNELFSKKSRRKNHYYYKQTKGVLKFWCIKPESTCKTMEPENIAFK